MKISSTSLIIDFHRDNLNLDPYYCLFRYIWRFVFNEHLDLRHHGIAVRKIKGRDQIKNNYLSQSEKRSNGWTVIRIACNPLEFSSAKTKLWNRSRSVYLIPVCTLQWFVTIREHAGQVARPASTLSSCPLWLCHPDLWPFACAGFCTAFNAAINAFTVFRPPLLPRSPNIDTCAAFAGSGIRTPPNSSDTLHPYRNSSLTDHLTLVNHSVTSKRINDAWILWLRRSKIARKFQKLQADEKVTCEKGRQA